jgi:hypothetical protein
VRSRSLEMIFIGGYSAGAQSHIGPSALGRVSVLVVVSNITLRKNALHAQRKAHVSRDSKLASHERHLAV